MGIFKVADLNIITEVINDNQCKEFFIQAHCEVTERLRPDGGEAFIVNIASPLYLSKTLIDSMTLGRGLILSNAFDKNRVRTEVESLIDRSNASNWDELFSYIEKYFDWV